MNPLRRSTEGNVYRAAAKAIDERAETFACLALGERSSTVRARFTEVFEPLPTDEQNAYPYRTGWYGLGDDARAARVIALCFMAAMVEAGDA